MKYNFRKYFPIGVRVKSPGGKHEAVKYLRIILVLCFILGIIAANRLGSQRLEGFGIWNTYFVENFKYTDIQPVELFFYILGERMPMFLLLLFLASTSFGTTAGILFMGWQGFAAGFFMAAAIVKYSIKGMLLVGVGLFPQYLIYIPIYIAYLYLAVFFKERLASMREQNGRRRVKDYTVFFLICSVLFCGFIAGIFLESYLNPYLLKNILKFF